MLPGNKSVTFIWKGRQYRIFRFVVEDTLSETERESVCQIAHELGVDLIGSLSQTHPSHGDLWIGRPPKGEWNPVWETLNIAHANTQEISWLLFCLRCNLISIFSLIFVIAFVFYLHWPSPITRSFLSITGIVLALTIVQKIYRRIRCST